ncbi:hypothetical protein RclHR1_34070001 [Rhizophagus clarus]|uniref:Uncharacterized protein n=1 Tax=Rhizophagus clarus TaxID=94130 RepID=A0A2Z6RLL9_9GLOM|nr:hypothetical protein RclHR1_34070001 [Rhizophagus clarus]
MPFIPQIIGLIWHKITEVLQIELQRKDQIKSAIVALCMYSYIKKSPDGSQTLTITEKHHRGEMRVILSEGDINKHITKSVDEIDKHIEETLQRGSYIPTSEKLANKKSTINPDNQGLIDPEMHRPSEKCLQGALGCYFADKAGKTDHLERRIFRQKVFVNI